MVGASRRRTIGFALSACVAVVALGELVAGVVLGQRVVSDEDWRAAASFVRERYAAEDRLVVAPSWADPVLREVAGDMMPNATVAVSDNRGADRIWELSIRGAASDSRPENPPDLQERIGAVTVRRWTLEKSPALYDFVAHVDDTVVTLEQPRKPCKRQALPALPSGLGSGPFPPMRRFICDRRRPWLWVGETILTDLDLQPRRCIWQHPDAPRPVRVVFPNVPLGDSAVFHAGIYYGHERAQKHTPVTLHVQINGRDAGHLVHRDGDGWARYEIDTTGFESPAEVAFETSTPDAHRRSFCWSGYTRSAR